MRTFGVVLSFLLAAYANAQLAWEPWQPSGLYGDRVAVIGTIEGDIRCEVCLTRDNVGNWRVGKLHNGMCRFAIPIKTDREGSSWVRHAYAWGGGTPIEVLTAASHDDYAWVPNDQLHSGRLFRTEIEGAELFVCRAEEVSRSGFRRHRRGIHSGQLYPHMVGCFYEYGGRGRKSPERFYTDSFEVLIEP